MSKAMLPAPVAGNRLALAIGGVDYAAYAYDAVNRLTDLSDSSAVVASYGYDVTNKATSRNLINGVNSTYEYDGLDRLTRLRDLKATTTVLDNQYGYNAASQIAEKTTPMRCKISVTMPLIDSHRLLPMGQRVSRTLTTRSETAPVR